MPSNIGIKRLTKEQVAKAMEWKESGLMYCEIARRYKMPESSLYMIMKKARQAGFSAWEEKVILY